MYVNKIEHFYWFAISSIEGSKKGSDVPDSVNTQSSSMAFLESLIIQDVLISSVFIQLRFFFQ